MSESNLRNSTKSVRLLAEQRFAIETEWKCRVAELRLDMATRMNDLLVVLQGTLDRADKAALESAPLRSVN
jgi:hypothetical protein